MDERRRYTGTQRLQLAWSLAHLLVVGGILGIERALGLPVTPVAIAVLFSLSWFVGLVALGLRERRRWNRMVEESSFSQQLGPHTADLERIIDGRSVTVSTAVPGVFSQTHTELRTTVTGVDASFTVRFRQPPGSDSRSGRSTGHDRFDRQFDVEGSEQNLARILTEDVRSALIDVSTAGVCTVTGEEVAYEVPFTNLSAEELDTIGTALVAVASRVEEVGQSSG